jgi:hypothetical protein
MKIERYFFPRRAMTLTELLVASTIALIVLGGIFMLTQFVYSVWNTERAKTDIVSKIQMGMERIQKELRVTDAHRIFYYPQNAATYSAISFPLAVDNNGDGFVEIDNSDAIIWDQTVIYHTYTNAEGKVELRVIAQSPEAPSRHCEAAESGRSNLSNLC